MQRANSTQLNQYEQNKKWGIMKLKKSTIDKIEKISNGWCWDNYTHDGDDDCQDKGEYFTILEALGCKLSWILDDPKGLDEEQIAIVNDAIEIINALQDEIKI